MSYSDDPVVESAFKQVEKRVVPPIFSKYCTGSDESRDVTVQCNQVRECVYAAVSQDCFPFWMRQLGPALSSIARTVHYSGDINREICNTVKQMKVIECAVMTGSSER